jgi:hypothetical protein
LSTQAIPRLDWPYLIRARGAAPTQLPDALSHLRSLFGERIEALPLPLLERLLNFVPWTGEWLVWLSQSIKCVEGADGYASLGERLVDSLRHDEACSVLQIAERLTAVGFDIGFDQEVLVDGAGKVPDLLARDRAANAKFYCEISVQYSAAALTEQSRAVDGVIETLLYGSRDSVLFAGQFLRPIAENEISGLAGRVQWELMEIDREPRMREIVIDGMLLLGIAAHSHAAQLASWALKHGVRVGTFSDCGTRLDELSRLALKIEDEVKQLPTQSANLLVIPAQNLFVVAESPVRLIEPVAE